MASFDLIEGFSVAARRSEPSLGRFIVTTFAVKSSRLDVAMVIWLVSLLLILSSPLLCILLLDSLLRAWLMLVRWLTSPAQEPAPTETAETLAVIIPAHDEASVIGATVARLRPRAHPGGLFGIADNCANDTAAVARQAGARVWERHNPREQNKGAAMRWLLNTDRQELQCHDAIAIFADSVADQNFDALLVRARVQDVAKSLFQPQGSGPPGKRVVLLRSTPISPDPRASRTAHWLVQAGWQVHVIGWDRSTSLPSEERTSEYTIVRIAIPARFGKGVRSFWPILRWQWGLLNWLVKYRSMYDVIHAADLDTVLPARLAAWLWKKHLVYDIYDFYAHSRSMPPQLGTILSAIERWIIGQVDAVILPDPLRQAQIGRVNPRRLAVIYNTPDAIPLPCSWKQRGLLRISCVGILTFDRSLFELLEVVTRHPTWIFDLAGFGIAEPALRQKLQSLPNIRFHGLVSYEHALELNASADVLVAIYDPSVPNHRYSSPNKLFEAMMLGKPIVVAKGTGVDQLVCQHRLGSVVTYGDVVELESSLQALAEWDTETSQNFAHHARRVYDLHYSSAQMQETLATLYESLISPSEWSGLQAG